MARSFDFKILMRLLQQESQAPVFSRDRRDFLQKTVVGTAASVALSGCGSFDRWVRGDSNRLMEEVMVIGAGLSGLAAAYHLKKNKIPYRVYEASSRVGGRVQTVFHANADHQFAELGAEFFEASHKLVLQWCKDLSLSIQEISYDPKVDRSLYWLNGKVVGEKEFRRKLRPLIVRLAQVRREAFAPFGTEWTAAHLRSHPGASVWDQQSLAQFLAGLRGSMDAATLECFENLCVSEWGVDSAQINLLHFLVRLDFEEKNARMLPLKIYRVEGGMSRMTQILGERVQGVVPDSTLRLGHQLIALRARSGGYECTFRTAKGSDSVWARQVICALPWSVLKEVDGIQGLELGLKKDFITSAQYATHSKVVSSFKDPVWRKKHPKLPRFQGTLRGQLVGQVYWDSSRGQAGGRGLLTSQRGGTRGQSLGANADQSVLKDLRLFFKDATEEESTLMANWSQKPFARGSQFNILPGQYLAFLAALNENREHESFFFAGEHMSFHDSGTMNGALETGVAAAEMAAKNAFVKALL